MPLRASSPPVSAATSRSAVSTVCTVVACASAGHSFYTLYELLPVPVLIKNWMKAACRSDRPKSMIAALDAPACYTAELPRSAINIIDPGAETRAGINRIRTAGLRRDFRSGAGRRAAACAKCVDIALCPCYDGLSRRAPARRCRAGGLHMSEPRLSVRDRCACTGEAAHAACAWFSPRLLRAGRCVARGRPGSSIGR